MKRYAVRDRTEPLYAAADEGWTPRLDRAWMTSDVREAAQAAMNADTPARVVELRAEPGSYTLDPGLPLSHSPADALVQTERDMLTGQLRRLGFGAGEVVAMLADLEGLETRDEWELVLGWAAEGAERPRGGAR